MSVIQKSKCNLTIGQEVFVTYLHENKNPFHTKISKIGKKYFTVHGISLQFNIEDLEQKHCNIGWSQSYKVWLTQNDYYNHERLKEQKAIIIKKIPFLNQETIDKILNIII